MPKQQRDATPICLWRLYNLYITTPSVLRPSPGEEKLKNPKQGKRRNLRENYRRGIPLPWTATRAIDVPSTDYGHMKLRTESGSKLLKSRVKETDSHPVQDSRPLYVKVVQLAYYININHVSYLLSNLWNFSQWSIV